MPEKKTQNALIRPKSRIAPRCQACGTIHVKSRRKYCSLDCRAQLVYRLNVSVGLLRALNTRYATFSFDEFTLILNVIPCGAKKIFSFFWQRLPDRKPAEDLARMVETLGQDWWKQRNKTQARYLASRNVLEKATKSPRGTAEEEPVCFARPRVNSRYLTVLQVSATHLMSADARDKIKSAYRKQVMRHHPDKNGEADRFRKIQEAYEELQQWLEEPVLTTKKGLYGKWCFDGVRWVPPL